MKTLRLVVVLIALSSTAFAQTSLVDRTFNISGISMHIRCGGQRSPGSPLIVLEAGAANSADTWRDVHGPIAQFARACAYDRPGMGSSSKPSDPLTADGYIKLLADLLKAAGEPGPFVLVGHSIGGVMAAMFSHAHPRDVAGLVLVDSSHPGQAARWRSPTMPQPQAPPAQPAEPAQQLPEPLPVGAFIDALGNKPWRGTIPLVVLARGRNPASSDPVRNQLWQELQKDWATRSPNSRHIVAANSGHYIQNDEPPLVIDAVRWVIEQTGKR